MSKQVSKQSGTPYHFSLDGHSLQCLKNCYEFHKVNGNDLSHSVIVRRAIRLYLKQLSGLNFYRDEDTEIKRAAKGVM